MAPWPKVATDHLAQGQGTVSAVPLTSRFCLGLLGEPWGTPGGTPGFEMYLKNPYSWHGPKTLKTKTLSVFQHVESSLHAKNHRESVNNWHNQKHEQGVKSLGVTRGHQDYTRPKFLSFNF